MWLREGDLGNGRKGIVRDVRSKLTVDIVSFCIENVALKSALNSPVGAGSRSFLRAESQC